MTQIWPEPSYPEEYEDMFHDSWYRYEPDDGEWTELELSDECYDTGT